MGVMSEWISVEDRLPEEKQSVLAIVNEDGINIIYQFLVCRLGCNWYETGTGEHFACKVTHWLPIPPLPTEE